MRQALHIFRKDARFLWREIFILLFTVAAFSFLEIKHALRWSDLVLPQSQAGDMAHFLMLLAAWVLIARAIHAEAIPGDCQFWRTRPYERTSLLGAKALFILIFVNLPILLADALILSAYGFQLGSQITGLVSSQLLLTAVLVLPIAALAAVTTGLVQLIFAILILAASGLAYTMAPRLGLATFWGPMDWINSSYVIVIIVLVTSVILALQYAQSRTALSRSLAAAGWAMVAFGTLLIPWTDAFAIQSRFSRLHLDATSVQAGLDQGKKWMIHAEPAEGNREEITIPLQIGAVPGGMEAKAEGLTFTIEAPDGTTWSSSQPPPTALAQTGLVLRESVDASFYRKVRSEALRLRGSLYLTVFSDRRVVSLPLDGAHISKPQTGVCSAARGKTENENFVLCRYPFRSPPSQISIYFADYRAMAFRETISYSPFPADLRLSPVSLYFATSYQPPRPRYRPAQSEAPLATAEVVTREPIAFIQRDFEIGGFRLADFESVPSK